MLDTHHSTGTKSPKNLVKNSRKFFFSALVPEILKTFWLQLVPGPKKKYRILNTGPSGILKKIFIYFQNAFSVKFLSKKLKRNLI
jgi:hypothetical protein